MVILLVGMIVLTACPSYFDNRLEKNIDDNMENIIGSWDSKYHTLKISRTLIKGNYFADVIMKENGVVHPYLMHVTKINDKYYASLVQKGIYENPGKHIVEFSVVGNTLKTKMLESTEKLNTLSPKKLELFIQLNGNTLSYNAEFSINYQKN